MNSKTTAANNQAPRTAMAPADTIAFWGFKGLSGEFCCRQVSLPNDPNSAFNHYKAKQQKRCL